MIRFGNQVVNPVFCATGARGFWGEGYPFHSLWKYAGMNWSGMGFSAKTMTLLPRRGKEYGEAGNMLLKADGTTPREWKPKSIFVDFFHEDGQIINAVGLTNFGLPFYLKAGHLQRLTDPFFISISLDAQDSSGQENELREICKEIKACRPFRAKMAVQINYGCPNSGHDLSSFYDVMCQQVALVKGELNVPVWVNCNALMPTKILQEVAREADGLWIGNTIPWRAPETVDKIDWGQFGEVSPIRRRGINADGGLSSHQCLQFTIEKIRELRESGVSKQIVGGNGIRSIDDLTSLHAAGANGVFIGSLAVVRPVGMASVAENARRIFF